MKVTAVTNNWEFSQIGAASSPEWLRAQVPGHIHLDLMRNGIIADPFERMHEAGVQWIDQTGWSYRTSFDWSPNEEYPRRVLQFEGLDTFCTVFLNDEQIGRSENMFVEAEIDVSSHLKTGNNTLRVDFESAQSVGLRKREEYFRSEGISENVANFEARSFVRKAQYMFGWDWGPILISCGIWRPVNLIEFSSRIKAVDLSVSKQDGIWRASISSEMDGSGVALHQILDPAGKRIAELSGDGVVEISNPRLWWPHDLGDQPLYSLVSALNGQEVRRRFGLRSVRLIREDDAYGQSFRFEVNEVPVWSRGANWIPDHSFPSTVTRARYFGQLLRAKSMGMNMLRVWGGGLYEAEDFYDAADELGILIWQDFPFGCAYYPDTGDWQKIVREEASQNVRRLRHRASLALWCGNNENLTMWEGPWGGIERRPTRYFGEHLYNDVLPQVLIELDPDRPYIPTSPWGSEGQSNDGGVGDQHYWDVWHGRGDWLHYADSTARFSSEFGFSSSPSLAVWDSCLDSSDRDPYSPVVKWHDKTRKGYDTYIDYIQLHYPEIKTVEDLVYCSQLNQRDAIRFAFAHYRSSEFCKGALIWQLNDCWPVQSWAIIDCLERKKALGFELQRSCAPQMIALKKLDGKIFIHAINDGKETWETEVRAVAIDVNGENYLEHKWNDVSVPAFSRMTLGEFDASTADPYACVIWVDAKGSCPTWTLMCEPKDFAGRAHPIRVTKSDLSLNLDVSGPVVDLWLTTSDAKTEFSPNYLTWTGGAMTVNYSGSLDGLSARSLSGIHELVFE